MNSMPRSGSTLFSNILNQNPRFHATHTSGCLDLIFGLRNQWDNLVEHKAHPLPVAKKNVLRGILYNYYEDINKEVIFDKSRGWVAYLEMMEEILDQKAKVLVCIRNIPDVLASLEKLNRNTSKINQPPGEAKNYFQFQTIEGRCNFWLQNENVVGLTYNRIMDAVNRGYKDRLHFIQYEKLTTDPINQMKAIYDFIEEPYFEHNFEHIEQTTQEDDSIHGYVGLHKIKNKLSYHSDAISILGEQLVQKYSRLNLAEKLC